MNKAPSSSAPWPLALGGLLVLAAALAWFLIPSSRRGAAPQAPALGVPSATARAPRARPQAVAVRPRAGISGRVTDPAGNPVAAASVCAWASSGNGLVTTETQAPRCAKTDAAGAYALTDLFPATPLTLSAAAESFAPVGYRAPDGDRHLRLGDGEQRAGVDFVLRGGGVRIHGSVIDVTGGGVGGALVVGGDSHARVAGTSDAKGEFTLWVEPGRVHVRATANGYAPGWTNGPAPGHVFKIHLVPGSTLVGRAVIAGSETPVPDARVDGIQVEGGASGASARTDDEGRFRIEGLMPGRYRVEATAEGREGYSRSSVTLGMGETSAEVRIEMDPAFVVRGRVIDKATKEPCTEGRVTITDRKQSEYSEAPIEPDGSVRMASVIPGTYRVEVSCKGHVDRDDYPTITIKDKDAAPMVWEVDKGASLRIEVVDAKGRPIQRADVRAYGAGDDGSFAFADHVEGDGTFLLSGLKPGDYSVSVDAASGGDASKTATVSAGREERLRIELPLSGAIEGVVEDEERRPAANVWIIASGMDSASTQSLDDGSFSLTGLPSGEYEVRASAGASWRDDAGAQVVKVTVTAPDRAKVKMTVKGRNGIIEGRVTDSAGQPVTDAFIDFGLAADGPRAMRYGDRRRAPVVADTEGHFKIEGLADGEYNVRAYRKGGGEASAERVRAGTRDLTLRIAEGGSIAGIVTAGGTPVERFRVTVREATTSFTRRELLFHAGGAFAIRDLPPGRYEVEAETPEGTARAELTLAEGEQKTGVALALTLRADVRGRVVDAESGAPIAGARLGVEGDSKATLVNSDDRNHKSGADGYFHLEAVLAGRWTLTVTTSDPRFEPASVPIEVPDGGGAFDAGTIRLARRAPEEP